MKTNTKPIQKLALAQDYFRILGSVVCAYIYTCFHRTSIYLRNPCLDCENSDNENLEFGEYDGEIFYKEPDLSGGIEGIDYGIIYGTQGGEA